MTYRFRATRAIAATGASLVAIATTLLSAWPSVASASQAAPPAGPATGEIIVTANKRAQNINDVELAITALSGNQLLQKGIVLSPFGSRLSRLRTH